jgi:hypothetical protein
MVRVRFSAGDFPPRRLSDGRRVWGARSDGLPPVDQRLVDVLKAGRIKDTRERVAYLNASLEALRCQHREHRPRPGVRQISREAEFYRSLGTLYQELSGPGAVPGGDGGPFYQFCRACAEIEGVKIPKPATFRKSFSGENIRKR